MHDTRRAACTLEFNGVSVTEHLESYLQSVTYTDPATGDSDSLEITLQNVDMGWLGIKYPHLGDTISGSMSIVNWDRVNDNRDLSLGTFTLDTIEFSGGPLECEFSALSLPADTSFRIRERTKTWENVTLQAIASEIAGRYGLELWYDASEIPIASIEQSQQTDSAFLYKTAEDYGISMKVYNNRLVLYDMGRREAQNPVIAMNRMWWVGDDWTYRDTLIGVYTGAQINYKRGDDSEEYSYYVGFCGPDDPGARTLYINETVGSEAEADIKVRARVNASNAAMTTLSGKIWPNLSVVAGTVIQVQDMEHINGYYLVDKMTLRQGGSSGLEQSVEMHRIQKRM